MNRINQFNFIDKVCPKVIREINKFRKNIPNVPLFINVVERFMINNHIFEKNNYVLMTIKL